VVCHPKIGFISFAINWRLYTREKTVRRINRQRPKEQRLKFQSKYRLARAMLAEIAPLLPDDFRVYILFDSWYSSAKLYSGPLCQDTKTGRAKVHCQP